MGWCVVWGSASIPDASPRILAGAPAGLLTLWVELKGQNLLRKILIEEEMKQKLLLTLPLLLAAGGGITSRRGDAHLSLGLLGPHVQVISTALLRAQRRICSRNLGT